MIKRCAVLFATLGSSNGNSYMRSLNIRDHNEQLLLTALGTSLPPLTCKKVQ